MYQRLETVSLKFENSTTIKNIDFEWFPRRKREGFGRRVENNRNCVGACKIQARTDIECTQGMKDERTGERRNSTWARLLSAYLFTLVMDVLTGRITDPGPSGGVKCLQTMRY